MEKTGSKPTDELVRRAIIGDGEAFTQLWDTNINALKLYLSSTVMKHYDSFFIDDICSRSFEKAFRQIGTYDPSKSKFSTWLKAIAHNTALDIIEAEERAKRRFVSIDDAEDRGEVLNNMGDGESTPLESIIRDEDAEKLGSCIDALPAIYRDIARMRMLEGMRYKEISDLSGIALNTVRTRIRRAKALLDSMNEGRDDE